MNLYRVSIDIQFDMFVEASSPEAAERIAEANYMEEWESLGDCPFVHAKPMNSIGDVNPWRESDSD